ncbi:MAG: hypothetical protein ACD_79C00484G0006 [uncultured bacterium]|nr:MAG: hypothetical protein ACD_79C00484G0006 [uncultured bacterium]
MYYNKRDLLELCDLTKDEFEIIFKMTKELKKKPFQPILKNKTLGLIFSKSSTRTRVSFEVGISQLGGNSLFLSHNEIQLGRGETVKDTALVLARYLDGVIIRTYSHDDVIEFADVARIPVINGLTDLSHPCQVLTDLYTIVEKLGTYKSKKIVYFGDCNNNMANSWLIGSSILGCHFVISGHKDYMPDKAVLSKAYEFAKKSNARIEIIDDPFKAVKNADVVYTDVWTSMGQEKESKIRTKKLQNWQINKELLKEAKNAIFMHCLPAHRGEEVTEEVLEGKQSVVIDQAENRLHVQKGILKFIYTSKRK